MEKETAQFDIIPSGETMKGLVGESLYDVWTQLIPCIDEKYGSIDETKTARHGNMRTNVVEAARRCALSMRGKAVWDLWSSLEKRNGLRLKRTKTPMPKRFSRFMRKLKPIMVESG